MTGWKASTYVFGSIYCHSIAESHKTPTGLMLDDLAILVTRSNKKGLIARNTCLLNNIYLQFYVVITIL